MVQKTSACFSLRRVKQLKNTSSLCASLLLGYLKHKGEDSTQQAAGWPGKTNVQIQDVTKSSYFKGATAS